MLYTDIKDTNLGNERKEEKEKQRSKAMPRQHYPNLPREQTITSNLIQERSSI